MKIKLPKRIAGVKIPKQIRKGPLMGFVNTPGGQVVLAQALLAIGGALAVRQKGGHPLQSLSEGSHKLSDDVGARLTRAVAAATHAFREAMNADQEELPFSDADTAAESIDVTEGSKKKSRVRTNPGSIPH
jgi:hypothetical protein